MWHVTAATRYMFKILIELSRRTSTPIVVRPGPWEQQSVYRFLTRCLPRVSVEPNMTQADYVRKAFVILDEASSLGLEALLVNTPVISTQGLIPRLEEHIGGEGAGLFNAAYKSAYWQPTSVEEAVESVLKAERGALPSTPYPERLAAYLKEYHSWPRVRPSSFEMGDAILELLDVPKDDRRHEPLPERRQPPDGTLAAATVPSESAVHPVTERNPGRSWRPRFGGGIYRHMPGSVGLLKAQLLWQCLFSRDREHLKRYHYFSVLYPHHRAVAATFRALWNRYAPHRRGEER